MASAAKALKASSGGVMAYPYQLAANGYSANGES
jgi:hypothetical protein